MQKLQRLGMLIAVTVLLHGSTSLAAFGDDNQPAAASPSEPVRAANGSAASTRGWSTAPFQLNDGTSVLLRLDDNLTSGTEAVGQIVRFEVANEVRVDNVTVIGKGAPAFGTVIEVSRNRNQWQPGLLKIALESVLLNSGDKAPLRTSTSAPGGQSVALSDFAKQGPITKGAELTAYLDGDLSLDASKLGIMPLVLPVAGQPMVLEAPKPAAKPAAAPKRKTTRRQHKQTAAPSKRPAQ